MPLSITTLNNNAAVAKNFTEVGKDRVSSEFLNSDDSTSTFDSRMVIKQRLTGKTKSGVPIRQSLVQYKIVVPTSVVINGNTQTISEEMTVNLTLTAPVAFAILTSTNRKDAVSFIKNFLTPANVDALSQGQV
jgi:6,7-dimethyl-8-ribityllumazine synthase